LEVFDQTFGMLILHPDVEPYSRHFRNQKITPHRQVAATRLLTTPLFFPPAKKLDASALQ
jgi:hypothetical protein